MKHINKKLLILLIFAFTIRLVGLNQSFWLDEAISANLVKNYSFTGIITQFSPLDFHPPLFYLLLKVWSLVFGTSVVGLRLFSVTVSILSGIFIYKIGKLLFKKNIALWATAFFLLNPLFIYYSQELRMYSLVTLFLSGATFYFFKLQKSSSLKSILLFNLFIFFSFLTFYGSVFFIATLFLLLILQKKYTLLLQLIPGFTLSLLLISPLLYKQLFLSQSLLKDVTNWSLVLGKANLKNLLLIPVKFTFGRFTFYPKNLYYLLASLWTFIVFFTIFRVKKSQKTRNIFFLFFLPLFLAFFVSFKLPMLQYFRYLYLLPLFSLLLSISKTKLKPFLLVVFTVLSFAYLLTPSQHREDWKSLANALPQNSDVYLISSFADPLKYYRPDLNIVDIRQFGKTDQVIKPPIFLIPYGFDIFGLNPTPILKSFDFSHQQTQNFRQISLETWVYDSP